MCKKYGGNPDAFDWGTWGFFDWSIGKTWPTLGTNNKARKYGWTRVDDTYESWIETFKSFELAGILPKSSVIRAESEKMNKKMAGAGAGGNGVDKTNGH